MAKTAWKSNEFIAHSGGVRCLALGHSSGGVLATGGEDAKVNTWVVHQPNCYKSLGGHTSPIDAVRFGNKEEMVAAGSMSGALKIWDLDVGKIVRTLSGHTANIKSLDFHPYGDFVASGSQDTNVKIWDIRRRGCIFTYRGHGGAVSCLKFSPDGRWIVSGSQDSNIRLWDLTAGKLIAEFTQHKGPVTAIEFHPREFLLATASHDRTVKFWDLETFQLVSSTPEESSGIRTICFHPDGSRIYTGADNSLRTYTWEPAACQGSIAVGWGKVSSIVVGKDESSLIGASFNQELVSTYVVDLKRMESNNERKCPLSARKNYVDQPRVSSSPKVEPNTDDQDVDEELDQNIDHIKNLDSYEHVFQPQYTLRHSPPKESPLCVLDPGKIVDPVLAPQVLKAPEPRAPRNEPKFEHRAEPKVEPKVEPRVEPKVEPRAEFKPVEPKVSEQKFQNRAPDVKVEPRKLDVNPDEFLPAKPKPKSEEENEQSIVKGVLRGHDSMEQSLSHRSRSLDTVRALWSSSVRTALDSAVSMNDNAVIVDILNILSQKPKLCTLDLSSSILVQANKLLTSKYENYVICACACVRLILKNYRDLIKSNVKSPPGGGVDLTREERYRKCLDCYDQLTKVKKTLLAKQGSAGKMAPTFRELLVMLDLLE